MIVIGGGLAGVACARRLQDGGQLVRLLERSHRLGGRMAVRTERLSDSAGLTSTVHPVDLGAPYFTVREPGFAAVVADWQRAGLARPWTDSFATADPVNGLTGVTTGPQRWSAPGGLRSLVEALTVGLDVRLEHPVAQVSRSLVGDVPAVDGGESLATGEPQADDVMLVDGEPAAAVVLAMPDPQAARLLPADLAAELQLVDRPWTPVITVRAAWPERCWPEFDGVFVADSAVLTWLADSGRSRGDSAPVLVVHSTADLAGRYLDDPAAAITPMLVELSAVLKVDLPSPDWARAHRWTYASAAEPHPEPFALVTGLQSGSASGLVGVCGDGWGPRSRVEQAWTSGTSLAERLLDQLAVS